MGITNPHKFRFPELEEVALDFARRNKIYNMHTCKYQGRLILNWQEVEAELKRRFKVHPVTETFREQRGRQQDSCTYQMTVILPSGIAVLLANVDMGRDYLGEQVVRNPKAPGLVENIPIYGEAKKTIERLDKNKNYWFLTGPRKND